MSDRDGPSAYFWFDGQSSIEVNDLSFDAVFSRGYTIALWVRLEDAVEPAMVETNESLELPADDDRRSVPLFHVVSDDDSASVAATFERGRLVVTVFSEGKSSRTVLLDRKLPAHEWYVPK